MTVAEMATEKVPALNEQAAHATFDRDVRRARWAKPRHAAPRKNVKGGR